MRTHTHTRAHDIDLETCTFLAFLHAVNVFILGSITMHSLLMFAAFLMFCLFFILLQPAAMQKLVVEINRISKK